MSYTTYHDIETRLGPNALAQLTDDTGAGNPDPAVVEEARAGAEGEVDSYLAPRYAVPVDLSAAPEAAALLKTVALDLVEQRLHARRPPVPPDVTARRAAALHWLERAADGTVALPAAPAGGLRAATTGHPRVLSRKTLDDF